LAPGSLLARAGWPPGKKRSRSWLVKRTGSTVVCLRQGGRYHVRPTESTPNELMGVWKYLHTPVRPTAPKNGADDHSSAGPPERPTNATFRRGHLKLRHRIRATREQSCGNDRLRLTTGGGADPHGFSLAPLTGGCPGSLLGWPRGKSCTSLYTFLQAPPFAARVPHRDR
jgi:hypothetical protein